MKKCFCLAVILCLLLSGMPAVEGSQNATFTQRTIKTTQTDTFRYWLYTPKNPTPNMPLVVYLHGGSGKGSDLSLITGVEGFPAYLQRGELAPRAYVVIPQLTADRKGWTDVGESLLALIRQTVSQYSLDSANVSLTGHSMGGTGTWSVALSYPGTFARIAPLSGSVRSTQINLNKLKNMPIRAYVGDADTIVEPESSISFVEALQAMDADAEITVLEGATHFDVPAAVYLDSELGLLDWLIGAKFSVGGVGCATWQDAVSQEGEITLLRDAEAEGTLTGDIRLNLNGHTLTGQLDGAGHRVYLRDSQTDDFTIDDEAGYGRYLCDAPSQPQAGYLQLGESVHRVIMEIEAVSLRAGAAGIYYRCRFRGDEPLQGAIESFGVALGAGKLPELTPGTYSEFTDTGLFSGETLQNGTLLKGILKQGHSLEQNQKNSNLEIYGQTYLHLQDGTVVLGEPVSVTFREVVEEAAAAWEQLTEIQREELAALYQSYQNVLRP